MMQRFVVRLGRTCLFNRFATSKPAESPKEDGMTLELFYRNLLRNTRVRLTSGMGRFDVSHMNSMTKLTRTPEDAKLLLEAYYNLLGNFTSLNNTATDRVISKYLEVGGDAASILELYEHHTFLSYFPHYQVTNQLLQAVKDDAQKLEQLLKLLRSRIFIKLDDQFVVNALEAAKESAELTTSVLQLAAQRGGILQKHPEVIAKAVANGLVSYTEETKQLFELAREGYSKKPPTEAAAIIEYARLLMETGDVADSLVKISKLTDFTDAALEPYLQSLLAIVSKLKQQKQSDQLSKLRDEFNVLLSSKPWTGESANTIQQLHELFGDKPPSGKA